MKNLAASPALAATVGSLLLSIQPVSAQSTAFACQGRLSDGANPANGTSDRSAKEKFTPVSSSAVLDKVAALPITEWSFKNESAIRTSDRWPRIFTRPSAWAWTKNTLPPWTKAARRWRPFKG